MENLLDFLNYDLNLILILIITIVSWMLMRVLMNFIDEKQSSDITTGHLLEFMWTVLPSLILAIIAFPSFWLLSSSVFSDELNPSITIKAIGHQWYWSYEYIIDNSIESIDSIMIPVEDMTIGYRLLESIPLKIKMNETVRLIVTSSDVLHSWAVPSLGIKIDAVPGRLNEVVLVTHTNHHFKEIIDGRFLWKNHNMVDGDSGILVSYAYGQCSEICGVQHAFMPIKVAMVV